VSLPPLANVVAYRTPDPAEADALARRLRDEGFALVGRPHPTWVVATDPFPGAPSPSGFAEGADRVAATRASEGETFGLPDPAATPGDVTAIAVARDGSATLVRSAGGLVPVYVDDDRGRVLLTTRFADMLRYRRRAPVLDPLVHGIWMTRSGVFPDRRTFIEDVRWLPRGHALDITADGAVTTRRWWDARPRRATDLVRGPENAAELRAALREALERELDPDGESLLTLSGGVDSSAVGALAGGLGRKVVTASLLPANPETRARDLGYIESLAELVPNLRLGLREPLTTDLRLELLAEAGIAWHAPHPVVGLLPRAVERDPVRVVFGGEFADHTVGSTMILDDWAAHTPMTALITRPLPRGRQDLRTWVGYRLRRRAPRIPFPPGLPDGVRPELHEEYAEWLDRRWRAAADDDGPRRYLTMLLEREGFLAMHWEMASALGIRRCFPFVSRRTLELAYRTHPADVVGPGTKKLLRAALAGDVPDRHLHRPDKGHPGAGEDQAPRIVPGPFPEGVNSVVEPWLLDEKPMGSGSVRSLTQLVGCASASDHARASRAREGRHPAVPVPHRPPSQSERPDD
jgi:hypothetical protein